MKNKLFIKLVLLVLSITILSGVAAAAVSSHDNQYYKWGVLLKEQNAASPQNAEIAPRTIVKANDFTISEKEISNSAAEWELNNGYSEEQAEETAKNRLISKYSIYYYAKENGYEVTDEHIKSVIKKMKEDFAKASNRSDFEAFLNGLDMTSDEYFDSQYENLLIYETIANFKQNCFNNFSKEFDSSKYSQQIFEDMFDEYYAKIVNDIILNEQIEEYIN